MIYIIRKTYQLVSLFNLVHSVKLTILFLQGISGVVCFFLPSLYFYKIMALSLQFLFLTKFFFRSFLKHFFYTYNQLFNFYFVKIKMRGLGYRIRYITDNLFAFFFNYTNYYYFYVPKYFLVKAYKKRMFFISYN